MAKRPVRVLFILQRPEAWGNVASIWQAMAADPAFDPVAWLLPYNVQDPAGSMQRSQVHRELLRAEGVPWVEWRLGDSLADGQFDVAVFTLPYDRERPRALWFDRVRASVRTIVYVPYGLSVGAGIKNLRLQYAQPLQIGADLVVARSQAEKDMYARWCPAGSAHVRVLGHPRFDTLLQKLQEIDTSALEARIAGRVAILWNSHFSFGHRFSQSANFSSFDLIGPELLDYFVAHARTLCLVWRPHPGLFRELTRQGLLRTEQLDALRAELEGLGVILDEQASHLPAFACSHAMISDPGSFWFEYLATGKPFLPLLNPDGELLNDEANTLVATCGSASSFREVAVFIDKVAGQAIDLNLYKTLSTVHLPLLDGQAGMRVCEALSGHPSGAARAGPVLRSPGWTRAGRAMTSGHAERRSPRMPPITAELQRGLLRLRSEKAAQSSWRKWLRRKVNSARTSVAEHIKKWS